MTGSAHQVFVTIRGREYPRLAKLLGFLLTPFMRWRSKRRQRVWQPHIDRISRELESELPGGRSNPDYLSRFGERVADWFRDHPEMSP